MQHTSMIVRGRGRRLDGCLMVVVMMMMITDVLARCFCKLLSSDIKSLQILAEADVDHQQISPQLDSFVVRCLPSFVAVNLPAGRQPTANEVLLHHLRSRGVIHKSIRTFALFSYTQKLGCTSCHDHDRPYSISVPHDAMVSHP
ncbi:hypothetical protein F4778DRAFT_240539 [Xylariomycetidae sp. FL2044]|nr:hypothetical protein F4778DRAFT_240539 [Xylariomycetidae sp. FL2044]